MDFASLVRLRVAALWRVRTDFFNPHAPDARPLRNVSLWLSKRVWVRAWAEEEDVTHVRPGMAARVEIDALDGAKLPGDVVSILVAPDGQERTLPGTPISPLLPDETRFRVKIAIEPGALSSAVLPGMSAGMPATATLSLDPDQATVLNAQHEVDDCALSH